MMLSLPHTLRGKLLCLILVTTMGAVVIQSAVFRTFELLQVKPTALAELSTDADVIATHSAATLAFNDPDAATMTLAALDASPRVLAARIVDKDKKHFAAYKRTDQDHLATTTIQQGHRFEGERLLLGRPITHDGEELGSLLMAYDLSDYYATVLRNVLISFLVGILAIGVSMLAALRLQRRLTGPVRDLVHAARDVSQSRNYSVRVAGGGDDEFGVLKQSFNEMLNVIESRDEELMRTQEALRTSNEQLQQFAYVASHDLQEPLRKIQTFSSLLNDDYSDQLPEEAVDFLSRMDSAATRMRNLVTDLLTYSRISSKKPVLVDIDLEEAVTGVLSDLELRIQENAGTVIKDPLPTVRADELHVRQLFQNLIGNALKFVRPGVPPVVRIRVRKQHVRADCSMWQITIEDNGIGFEQSYADRIFLPFQRLHGRGEYEGTGMGLAVCRRIADRYGWNMDVTSQPGVGTTFKLTIPASDTLESKTRQQSKGINEGVAA